MKKAILVAIVGNLSIASQSIASTQHHQHHQHDYPNSIAPIGVMGSHLHEQGKWMTSYRYSHMEMDGNLKGSDDYSNSQIASEGFMVAPQNMTMEMHMFGLMYGLTNDITLVAMGSYKDMEMDHRFVNGMNSGKTFKTQSKGFGDTKISALFRLKEWNAHVLHLSAGLSLPTGSTDKKDVNTVTGALQKLPYPMQLGSGTFDVLPGITYNASHKAWSWGAQAAATIRTGQNEDEYRLGDDYEFSTWGGRNINDYLGVSVRLNARAWGNIDGADPAYTNLNLVPTVRTKMRGGKRLDALLGFNLVVPHGFLKGQRAAFEFGVPIYQDLDGIQLETDYRFMLGMQLSF